MEVTEEESRRLQSALENPEFRQLFQSYMEEIQDPKHREENEAYIKQLESSQDVPEGKLIIHPRAEICIKSWKCCKAQKAKEKVFINIVSSTKISEPVREIVTGGSKWSMPYSIGPPHMEKDSSSSNVSAFDCCYHPLVLMQAEKDASRQVREMMIRTAIEGVQSYYSKAGQDDVIVGPEYKEMKNVKYKSGEVLTMVVSSSDKDQSWTSANMVKETTRAEIVPKLSSGIKSAEPTVAPEVSDAKDKAINSSAKNLSKSSTNASDSSGLFKKGFLNKQSISTTAKIVTKSDAIITDTLNLPLPKPKVEVVTPVPSQTPSSNDSPKPKLPQKQTNPPILLTNYRTDSLYTNEDCINKLILPGHLHSNDTTNSTALTGVVSEVIPKALVREMPAGSSHLPISALSGGKSAANISPVTTTASSVTESSTAATTSENLRTQAVNYTLSERGVITIGDFPSLSRQQQQPEVHSSRPKELVCRFQVPLAAKPSILQLDVSERSLLLQYPGVYEQSVRLPYPVEDKLGVAKFDRKTMTLTVTLPVKPSVQVPTGVDKISNNLISEENKVVDIEIIGKGNDTEIFGTSNSKVSLNNAVDTKAAHNHWISSPSPSEGDAESFRLRDEIALKAAEARKTLEGILTIGREEAEATANSWKQPNNVQAEPMSLSKIDHSGKKERNVSSALESSNMNANNTSSTPIPPTEVDDEFIACSCFVGARIGYIFGTRSKGTGYYIDSYTLSDPHRMSSNENVQQKSCELQKDDVAVPAGMPLSASSFPYDCRETRHTIALLVQVPLVLPTSIRARLVDNRLDVSFITASGNHIASSNYCPQNRDSTQSSTTKDPQHQSQLQSKQSFYGMSFVITSSDLDPAQLSVNPARANVAIVIGKLSLSSTSVTAGSTPSTPSILMPPRDVPVEYLHTDPAEILSVVSFMGEDPTILSIPSALKTHSLDKTQLTTKNSTPTSTHTHAKSSNSENQKSTQLSGIESTSAPVKGDTTSATPTSTPGTPTKQLGKKTNTSNKSKCKTKDKAALGSLQKATHSLDRRQLTPDDPLLELF